MRHSILLSLSAFLAMAFAPVLAKADAIATYNVTFTSTLAQAGGSGTFTYDSTTSTVTASSFTVDSASFNNSVSLISESDADGSVQNFVYLGQNSYPVGVLSLTIVSGGYRLSGDFTGNAGFVYISDQGTFRASPAAPAAVPEPSSFVLVGTGALSAIGTAKRRWMRR